jgi:hypothetical protein
MKIFFRSAAVASMILFTHCSSVDYFVRSGPMPKKPNRIIIGVFEKRSLVIDGNVEKSIREALRFELRKKGYEAYMLGAEAQRPALKPEEIMKITADQKAELLLQGTISIDNGGDPLSSDNDSMIAVTVYDASGMVVCEIRHYCDQDIALTRVHRDAVSTIVSRLDAQLTRLVRN